MRFVFRGLQMELSDVHFVDLFNIFTYRINPLLFRSSGVGNGMVIGGGEGKGCNDRIRSREARGSMRFTDHSRCDEDACFCAQTVLAAHFKNRMKGGHCK